uniref:Uncharacterized protein n=1 Tax=Lactuca sativa TaxID=4236 RepID=A0A9R1V862_LACSA|nr:hypothetical protein LSAT_V11C600298960 [Lactuca sativa]
MIFLFNWAVQRDKVNNVTKTHITTTFTDSSYGKMQIERCQKSFFEDVSDNKLCSKTVLVKVVGVMDANPDTVFEVFLNVDKHRRYEYVGYCF